ncbi:ABC transporter permease [Bifidobacterium sp.]|uniref:ABC transporter permease n=1 Tax=Bifidobacterium sp. TaxID=41200 RepID=UPI0039EA866E
MSASATVASVSAGQTQVNPGLQNETQIVPVAATTESRKRTRRPRRTDPGYRRNAGPFARLAEHFRRYWQLWLMVTPAICFIGLFAYVPMYGVQLAFRDFVPSKGLAGGPWVGLKYFRQFLESPMFGNIMKNTISISLWTMVMGFIAPIILALLINQIGSKKIKGFVQTITYMPHFISTVVIVAMISIFLTPDTGLLGRFLGDTSLLGNPDLFTPIYWISEVWQHVGWNSIIYLAALSSVDTSLYEAAKVDGARRMQLIRYVDFPTIMPTCGILLILNMGSILNVGFEKVFLMQNALNLSASEVISTYTYKIGIVSNQFSYSTAIGLFNTLINFVFLVIANAISKRVSETSIF